MRKPGSLETSRPDLGKLYATTIRKCREIVSDLVPQAADQFAAATSLRVSNTQFHENLKDAIVLFVVLHLDAPRRF